MAVTLLPISAFALSSSLWRRPAMKTWAPSSTNFFAAARPIPLDPPVMTAIFPLSFDMTQSFALGARPFGERAPLMNLDFKKRPARFRRDGRYGHAARKIWFICQGSGIRQIWRDHLFVAQMGDRLQELAVFVRAAESGSFSRAGRELGLSQPSVSRIISELEARLGVTLLLRTTRRITVTDAGALFLDRARDILAEIENAEDAARGLDSLRGVIRLVIPVVYGTRKIIPLLPKFLSTHPLLRVELSVADERQDLVAEGADIAIRTGDLDDSVFGARKLATLEQMV